MQPDKKHPLKSYFTFSVNERRAIWVLLVLALFFFLLPHLYPSFVKPAFEQINKATNAQNENTVDINHATDNDALKYGKNREVKAVSLFYFDPNTATLDEWIRLGVRKKTAETIIKYLMKGGRFKDPQDIKKIWGLSSEKANALVPYVRITSISTKKNHEKINTDVFTNMKDKIILLDVNAADQEAWESLPGIGPTLASRIIKFREKLGGFLSVQQVGETFGLPDSTFQTILPFLTHIVYPVNKLNINIHNEAQLAKHPYISYKTAKAIVTYREQNGLYKAVEEVKSIESISLETYNKIEKYISVE